jgi:hypothetical protein
MPQPNRPVPLVSNLSSCHHLYLVLQDLAVYCHQHLIASNVLRIADNCLAATGRRVAAPVLGRRKRTFGEATLNA